jgi:hypothetical protein
VTDPGLATIIARPHLAGPSQDMRYRSGVVIAWNPATGANIVNVGGTDLVDLPILNTSEAVLLSPGAVVALISIGDDARTMAILGRLTIPGTADAASALQALHARSASVNAQESTTSGTYTDLATVGPTLEDVLIGQTGRALVTVSALITVDTAKGAGISTGEGLMSYDISGATAVAANDVVALVMTINRDDTGDNFSVAASNACSRTSLVTGLNPGLHVFTAQYKSSGRTPQFTFRNITVLAV